MDLKLVSMNTIMIVTFPLCYGIFVPSWTNVLYSIIVQENKVPLGEALAFVKGYNGNKYAFFNTVTPSFILI